MTHAAVGCVRAAQIKKELGLEKDDKEALLTKFTDRLKGLTVPEKAQVAAAALASVGGWAPPVVRCRCAAAVHACAVCESAGRCGQLERGT